MQQRQTLQVKGMVCNRCISVLRSSLETLPVAVEAISLGAVTLRGMNGLPSYAMLEEKIEALNFQILEDRDQKIVRAIKKEVERIFSESDLSDRIKFSVHLAQKMNMSYDSLSTIFSKTEGIALASYIVSRRIDKIRTYLRETTLPLTEIAFLMGYSSVFHLSRQFKEVAGCNPSDYRKQMLS